MNTTVGDSFDIGWKVAAVIHGYAGKGLLDSYEIERKPVAVRNIERSGVRNQVHQDYVGWVMEARGNGVVKSPDEAGKALRRRIAEHVASHDGENKDHGIELGYRNDASPVVIPDHDASGASAPDWNYRNYIPSTWPGARAPHVFLADGHTSIFDLFGPCYTLVGFSQDGQWAWEFGAAATRLKVPLKVVHLPNEPHVAQVWQRAAVLVRPDDHVAWRAGGRHEEQVDVTRILNIATGKVDAPATSNTTGTNGTHDVLQDVRAKGFTGTTGNEDREGVKLLGAFQN